MRLGLLIKDREYRQALIDNISESDSDILLELIKKSDKIEDDMMLITDAKPADVDESLLNLIAERTVFLNAENKIPENNCNLNILFKYDSISRLIAEISDIYYMWQGNVIHTVATSRLIACCTDSDAFSTSQCCELARQIVYETGGSVLAVPLGYINEHSVDQDGKTNTFAKIMYRVRTDSLTDKSSFTYCDSYGISRLMLPHGRNPIAYLDSDDLGRLIMAMSRMFDTLILDISSCYRKENIELIKKANNIICFETGRRRIDFKEFLSEGDIDRMRTVRIDGDTGEAYAIVEYLREIYGAKNVS